MRGPELKAARQARGWSQQEAAARLGVAQAYLSMVEREKRRLSPQVSRKMCGLYRLPPTALPLPSPERWQPPRMTNQEVAEHLALLGYPGFLHLSSGRARRNPAELLMTALSQDDLEGRVVEGLPWLLLRYWGMGADWLVESARRLNLQNRLGFLVNLARRLRPLEPAQASKCKAALAALEERLEQCRLAREDALCQASMTTAERKWLQAYRPAEANAWNLLSDLCPEHLAYASPR